MRTYPASAVLSVLLSCVACAVCAKDDFQAPPLYPNMGSFHRSVTTRIPQAQRYVDQGFRFLYAFHYGEALRAFQQAAILDPNCAMAWWGIATANGPHINDPTVSADHSRAAIEAMHKAQEAADRFASPVEKALILAELPRYSDPPPADRAPLDAAYANAMRQVWKAHPQDADVGALFAESMMDLRPWNQWSADNKPQPGTEEILATLDSVLRLDTLHPLGNHLTVHAWEASAHPERALASADRLRNLEPGIAHMVHMPSHIDVRLGHWNEAIRANELAVAVDAEFLRTHALRGTYGMYVGHNYHMLAFAAMMRGDSRRAIGAIDELMARLPEDWRRDNAPLLDGSGFLVMPLEVRLRFGLWNDVLAAPDLPEAFAVSRTLRHYARGVAYAAKRQFADAQIERERFDAARKTLAPDAAYGLGAAEAALSIADHVLAGEMRYQAGDHERGLAELRAAVASEDALHYDEPPDWIQPVRHALGAALMRSGRTAEAERVYREDLARHPENGWALFGLARCLERQGRQHEASAVRARFERAWKYADVRLSTSCLCLPGI